MRQLQLFISLSDREILVPTTDPKVAAILGENA